MATLSIQTANDLTVYVNVSILKHGVEYSKEDILVLPSVQANKFIKSELAVEKESHNEWSKYKEDASETINFGSGFCRVGPFHEIEDIRGKENQQYLVDRDEK